MPEHALDIEDTAWNKAIYLGLSGIDWSVKIYVK